MSSPITCPTCGEGRIEVSSKIYFEISGGVERLPAFERRNDEEENVVIKIEDIAASDINDSLFGMPFNMEAELFVGCDHCGTEFEHAWTDDLLKGINMQSTRHKVI